MNKFDYRKCGEVAKWLTNTDSEGSSDEEFIYTLALYEQLRKADSNEKPDEKLKQLCAKDPGVIIRDFNSDEFLDNLENTISNFQIIYQNI